MMVHNVHGTLNSAGRITQYIRSPIILGKQLFQTQFYVTDTGPDNVILGMTFLKERNPMINWKEGWMTIRNGSPIHQKQGPTVSEVLKALKRYHIRLMEQEEQEQEQDEFFDCLEPSQFRTTPRKPARVTIEEIPEEPITRPTLPSTLPHIIEQIYPETPPKPNHTSTQTIAPLTEDIPDLAREEPSFDLTPKWVMEQDIDMWTRRMMYGDFENDLDAAIQRGEDLIWIKRKFTTSQQIAEEQIKGKTKQTIEEIIPEDFLGFRFVFEERASERLPIRKKWDHTIDLKGIKSPEDVPE